MNVHAEVYEDHFIKVNTFGLLLFLFFLQIISLALPFTNMMTTTSYCMDNIGYLVNIEKNGKHTKYILFTERRHSLEYVPDSYDYEQCRLSSHCTVNGPVKPKRRCVYRNEGKGRDY